MGLSALAQTTLTDDPFGYGVIGVLLAVCIRTIWVLINDLRQRGDKLEEALRTERENTRMALEGLRQLESVGEVVRRVLEQLEARSRPDDEPRSEPRTPRGSQRR